MFSILALTVNTADRVAAYWRQGLVTGLAAQELLSDLGFTQIDLGERSIIAWLNGVRMDFDGTAGPLFNPEGRN